MNKNQGKRAILCSDILSPVIHEQVEPQRTHQFLKALTCVGLRPKPLFKDQSCAYIDSPMALAAGSEKTFQPQAKELIDDCTTGLADPPQPKECLAQVVRTTIFQLGKALLRVLNQITLQRRLIKLIG